MSDDDLVERVARAIETKLESLPFATDPEDAREQYSILARAAIDAMREPTEKMRFEGSCFGGYDGEWGRDNTAQIWRAMIDTALGVAPSLTDVVPDDRKTLQNS